MFSSAGLLNEMVPTFDMFGRKLGKLGRVPEVEAIECFVRGSTFLMFPFFYFSLKWFLTVR